MKKVENLKCLVSEISVELKCELITFNLYHYLNSFTKPILDGLF